MPRSGVERGCFRAEAAERCFSFACRRDAAIEMKGCKAMTVVVGGRMMDDGDDDG